MKKIVSGRPEAAQHSDSIEVESQYQNLINWLSDPNVFSIQELEALADDFKVPYDANNNQKTIASQIVFWVESEKQLTALIQRVYRERPYLKRNEYPKQFDPTTKTNIAATFTAEFLFLKGISLEILCTDLGILEELNTSGYYYERVVEVLDAIERLNLTESKIVRKIIKTLPRRMRALRIFQPEPMKISGTIPEQPSTQTQQKVMHLLRTYSSSDLALVIAQYDFRCYGAKNVTTPQQVLLIFEYATKTKTFRKLVAAICHVFPNTDFSEFGLKPIIRHPNKVKKLKNKENIAYPYTLSEESAQKLEKYLRKLTVERQVRSSQFAEVATILGYNMTLSRGLEGPYLVKAANTRSEIHLLLMAIEQVMGVTIPQTHYKTNS